MARRPTPTVSWQRRSSQMASGKRASMREGPLADLFRKTDEDAREPRREEPGERRGERPEQRLPAEPELQRHAQERRSEERRRADEQRAAEARAREDAERRARERRAEVAARRREAGGERHSR